MLNLNVLLVAKSRLLDVISARQIQANILAQNATLEDRDLMGDVGIAIKVMPSSPEVNLEEISNKIKEKINVQDFKIEPLAFGLKALKILVVVPDKEGANTDKIENMIKEIEGVETVEIENVSLI